MTTYVALLRGINVGGKHSLPMQALRDILAAQGCKDVKTYIQSGNAVFHADKGRDVLAADIKSAIDQQFGFAPLVHMLTVEEFESIRAANPFPSAVDQPKSLHIGFLCRVPDAPDFAAMDKLKASSETDALSDGAFFLHAPDGIGRSKLAAKVDKCLGVETTGRNWRTASKVSELAESIIS